MIMTVTAGELRKDDYLVIDGGAWRVLNDSELLVDFDDQDPPRVLQGHPPGGHIEHGESLRDQADETA